jgi:hypothetical protein
VLGLDGHEEVRRAAQLGAGPGEGAAGVHQLGRGVGRAALVAAVAVLIRGAAARAGALHEAVGEEDLLLRVEELGDLAGLHQAPRAQAGPDLIAHSAVVVGVGAAVVIEADLEAGEVALVRGAHVGDQVDLAAALLPGPHHDPGAVGVVRADVDAVAPDHPPVAHEDVGLRVLDHVAEVDVSVRVGQGAGDEQALHGRAGNSAPTSAGMPRHGGAPLTIGGRADKQG